MRLRAFLIGTVTALTVISCGGGGGGNTAGGIGGTGVSFGPVTGFGSVIVNGVEYKTGSADFSVEGSLVGTGATGQNRLAVGMVVSVTHDNNGNAKSVRYKDDAEGPIANLNAVGNTFDVLGVRVTVDALTVYDGITTDLNSDGVFDIHDLANGNIVEVSGQITAANTVLATRVELKPAASCADGIEVKGTIDIGSVNTLNHTFTINALTVDYSSATLDASIGGPPTAGTYVEVKSNACPSGGTLVATAIKSETEGPDTSDLDSTHGGMEIKGTIADFVASPCAFTVNGQSVSASDSMCSGLADGNRVEVKGSLVGGVLVASAISNEDAADTVNTEATGVVTVVTHPATFTGTITVPGITGSITVNLTTHFEGQTQTFNLDTMAASSTCAEVKVNSAMTAISIEEKTCH